jgi:hypothetical protein
MLPLCSVDACDCATMPATMLLASITDPAEL